MNCWQGKMENNCERVRVFEFFSGIGGLRLGLEGALEGLGERGPKISNSKAFDTSPIVNAIYRLNQHDGIGPDGQKMKANVWRGNIETLKMKDLDGKAEIWLGSPPCQPFTTTRDALQLDIDDKRNAGFLHLMKQLEKMERKPEWIFIENVKGFAHSKTHKLWCEVMERTGYSWRQFLLTPMQFRVPNNRMRFYMMLHLDEEPGSPIDGFSHDPELIYSSVESCECEYMKTVKVQDHVLDCTFIDFGDTPLHKIHEMEAGTISGPEGVNRLEFYVDKQYNKDPELILPEEILKKNWATGLSYLGDEDRCSFCFTSAYGKAYHKSSGSQYHMTCTRAKCLVREEDMSVNNAGKIRLFHPKEILNIFGFPPEYQYPPEMVLDHRFRAVGQSVNVVVVRAILHSIFCHYYK